MFISRLEEFTFMNNNGVVTVTKNGEPFNNYTGDNAVLALIHRLEETEEALENIERHIRSTGEPVEYIVKELKSVLPYLNY